MEMKKKIAASLVVLLLVASFTGCINRNPPAEEKPAEEKNVVQGEVQKTVKETVTEDDPAAQDISQDMAEIESIEEEMNISDLEGLENDLDAIVW